MTLNNSAYTRTRFRAKLFQLSGETSTRFRAKPISTFGRNIEWPSVVPCSSYAWANVLWIIWVVRTWLQLHQYFYLSITPPLVYAMWAIFLLRNTRGGSAQTYGYRVVSASCRLLLCVQCYSLFGKDTLASNNLLAQITPTPSITPRHDLHSGQNVGHTWIPSL